MSDNIFPAIENLIRHAPAVWITAASKELRELPVTAAGEFVLKRLPATANADLTLLAADVVRLAGGRMSWEALGWALEMTASAYMKWQAEHVTELLWSGPAPSNEISARRIDQILYDLIANARQDILLVTFAAAKIARLTEALTGAVRRGVPVTLVLEFEQTSEGQLSYDALNAFPATLRKASTIYCWPVGNRQRNQSGRPGKLHAKLALIDDTALVFSANLTDDAFNRNLELGASIKNDGFVAKTRSHIDALIKSEVLCRV